MKRLFIAAAASLALAAPAAQARQKVRINLANAFPNSLTLLIGEAPGRLAKKVQRLSGGTLDIRVNEPGALVPALQAIQATGQGSACSPRCPST
jgi:TRAP-type mannitol/chloroaromatic compound transport system substrate-binding protein